MCYLRAKYTTGIADCRSNAGVPRRTDASRRKPRYQTFCLERQLPLWLAWHNGDGISTSCRFSRHILVSAGYFYLGVTFFNKPSLLKLQVINQTQAIYRQPMPGVENLGIKPYMWITECLHGQHGTDGTSYPQAVGLAATFW